MEYIYDLIVMLLSASAGNAANVPSSKGAYQETMPESVKKLIK